MKSLSNSKKLVLALLLVSIIGISGITFAYFTVQRTASEGNAISGKSKSQVPRIEFNEEKGNISIVNAVPMPDELGLAKSEEYTFTVRNLENKEINTSVILQVAKASTLDDNLVNVSINGTVKTLGELDTVDSADGYKKSYVITNLTLSGGETNKSRLSVWINENGDASNATNKTWSSKLLIVPSFK